MDAVRLEGKTSLVTGANTGIGKETAKELARRGSRVILACRGIERAEAAKREIVEQTGNEDIHVRVLDLASLKSVKDFAEEFNQTETRLDLLVNNAGVFSKGRQETQDGHELMFGVNHLGHFYLTTLLLDKLKASAPSRVVAVSSEGHKFAGINFKDVSYKRGFGTIKAYGQSKTANILFAVHLAKVLKDSGVTTYSLHPGIVSTELTRDYDPSGSLMCCFRFGTRLIGQKFISPEEGAKTSLYCCLEPSIADVSGRYYSDCKEQSARGYAKSSEKAKKLWHLSEKMCGLRASI